MKELAHTTKDALAPQPSDQDKPAKAKTKWLGMNYDNTVMKVQQSDDSYLVIPLLAKNDRYDLWFYGGRYRYDMTAAVERMLVFTVYCSRAGMDFTKNLYDFRSSNFCSIIRRYVAPHVTSVQLDEMKRAFLADHPIIDKGYYFDYKKVPAYGTEKDGLTLVECGCICVFTKKYEEYLLEMVAKRKNFDMDLMLYFDSYDMDAPDINDPFPYIMDCFLIQHGIRPDRYRKGIWDFGPLVVLLLLAGALFVAWLGITVNAWFFIIYLIVGIPLVGITNVVNTVMLRK